MRTSRPSWCQISGSTASQSFWFFSQFRLQSHVGLDGDTSQQRDGRLQLTAHHQRLWRASFAQQLHQARFYEDTSKTQLVSMVTEVHPASQLSSGTSLPFLLSSSHSGSICCKPQRWLWVKIPAPTISHIQSPLSLSLVRCWFDLQ